MFDLSIRAWNHWWFNSKWNRNLSLLWWSNAALTVKLDSNNVSKWETFSIITIFKPFLMIPEELNLWYLKKRKIDKSILLSHLKMQIKKNFFFRLIYVFFIKKCCIHTIKYGVKLHFCWDSFRKISTHLYRREKSRLLWTDWTNDYSWFHNWILNHFHTGSNLEECYGKTSFETMW